MSNSDEHQRLRELLGSYALGHVSEADEARARAHLDGCASCRADLAEVAPLKNLLDEVDVSRFDLPALPPGDLGGLIRTQVAGERKLREADEVTHRRASARRRTTTRAALGGVAAAVALAVLVGGFALGRGTGPETSAPTPPTVTVTETPTEPPAVTLETVSLSIAAPSVTIAESGLVAHTWGLEWRMSGAGFAKGEVFQASFRSDETGELVTAGAFIGTGKNTVTCNLQSALMRAQATELVVTDESGAEVLTAPL